MNFFHPTTNVPTPYPGYSVNFEKAKHTLSWSQGVRYMSEQAISEKKCL